MNEWLPLWENVVLRLAALCVASGIIVRYIVIPTVRGVRASIRRAKALTAEVEEVRRLVASQHSIIQNELTPNGGGSAVDKISDLQTQIHRVKDDLSSQHAELTEHIGDVHSKAAKLERDAEHTAASWIKYVFEHRRDHNDLHQWLRDEYGLDRRWTGAPDEPPLGPTGPERRGE